MDYTENYTPNIGYMERAKDEELQFSVYISSVINKSVVKVGLLMILIRVMSESWDRVLFVLEQCV